MTALQDNEDDPPNIPPASRVPSEQVDTDPAPDPVQSLLLKLIGLVEGQSNQLEEQGKKLAAVDRGVGSALTQLTELGGKVDGLVTDVGNLTAHHEANVVRNERLTKTQQDLSDALLKHAGELQKFRESVTQQASHEGERHEALRQSVSDLQQRANSGGGE